MLTMPRPLCFIVGLSSGRKGCDEKMRILITGANGFIGRSIIEELGREHEIFALGLDQAFKGNTNHIKDYFPRNITQPFTLDLQVDTIIHLAALNQTNINSDLPYDKFKEINGVGTKNVAKGLRFNRFIFFSTANLYAKEGRPITEASPLAPGSYYEQSKYEAELICQREVEEEKLVILRPVNIAGIKQENKAIVPYFFSRAIKGESIEVFVPKNRRIQLLSVKDLIRALEGLLLGNRMVKGILNLSSHDSMEVKQVAEKIISLCGSSSVLSCSNPQEEAFSEVRSDRVRELLGWKAQDSIDKIIMDYGKAFLRTHS